MTKRDYDNVRLQRLREASGLSQTEVAKKLRVARPTINRAETGVLCTFDTLKALAIFYKVDVTDLIYRTKLNGNHG